MVKTRLTLVLVTDGIIINQKKEVLLLKRSYLPFKNSWVLPGGHVDRGEMVEEALVREVFEETGLKIKKPQLLGVYSDPERDPRYPTASVVFLIKSFQGQLVGNKESTDQKFFPLSKLPKKIGFDHRQIINDFRGK